MRHLIILSLAATAAFVAALCATPALAQRDTDDDDGPGRPASAITVVARRLDAARENINPALGASVYALSNDTIEGRPGGETGTIGQILLQAPGVTQDASGQLRLRQSQGALQYRINNVILPDGLTDPSDTISARLAAKVELVTGALPAQYGLQSGGVVQITTKDGVYHDGGQAELYGGSHATIQPAFELGGSAGSLNYFASGQYQRSNASIASTDGSASPKHDATRQGEGLVYLDRVIGSQDRVSLILSASDERFEIPVPPGSSAAPAPAATRRDANHFAILALLHTTDRFTLQLAGFARASLAVIDTADAGDLALFGYGRRARETATSIGVQAEASYEPAEAHTLRGGVVITSTLDRSGSTTLAYPLDAAGQPILASLLALPGSDRVHRRINSVFAQDEWRLASTVTLNIGGRIDHVVDDTGDLTRFSPRASAVWRPDPATTVHLGYARYVQPAPIEDGSDDAAALALTSAALPGPHSTALRPETDDYYDLGAQRKLGNLTLGIDAYWRQASNLLDEVQLAGSYRSVTFNYGSGRIRGIELTATYAARRLSAWANLGIGDARGRQIVSNQAFFAPAVLAYAATQAVATTGAQTVTGSGGVAWRWDGFRLAGDMLIGSGLPRTAPRTTPGGVPAGGRLPTYAVANLSAVWRVATFHQHPFDLRIDVINLFDARYRLRDGTGLVPSPVAFGARRGLFVGIEQGF